MTTTDDAVTAKPERRVDKAQYLVSAVLVAVGAFVIYDALTLEAGFAKVDPVGPKMFPVVIGVVLIALAIVLAIAIPRGSVGEADAGEDVDPDAPADWRSAIEAAKGSAFLKSALGEDLHRTFTAIKQAEYMRVARTVNELDYHLYLHEV